MTDKKSDATETLSLLDGKVNLYKRPRGRYYQCSTYMGARNLRVSTKETNLVLAREFLATGTCSATRKIGGANGRSGYRAVSR